MATFTITNISSSKVHLGDFYVDLDVGESKSITDRRVSEVTDLASVQALLVAGSITFTIAPTAVELASGLLSPPNSLSGDDPQEVAASDVLSLVSLVRKSMTAGGGGSPDDVTVYAANALPFKFRVIDAWALIATAVAGSSIVLRDEAAGAGTALATISSAATGRVALSETATALVTPAAAKGLFIRRSDDGVAGEVFALIRRES